MDMMPIGLYPHYMHFLELQKMGLLETREILLISAKIKRQEDIKENQRITDSIT